MDLKTSILDYARYNHWANVKLAGWLKSFDVELLYQDTTSSFPSIDLTLQHIKNAQNFWYEVISNGDVNRLDEETKIRSVDEVIEEVLRSSQGLVDLVESFKVYDLYVKVSSPSITMTRYEFMLHVVNHNSYHRGQIITMARSLGVTVNIPNTDYDTYLWLKINDTKSLV